MENKNNLDGYSLRKNAFLAWCLKTGTSLEEMEKKLQLGNGELCRTLENHKKLDKKQITRLIYIMGAADAFFVLYFPSLKFRKKVYKRVFGKDMPLDMKKHKKWGGGK